MEGIVFFYIFQNPFKLTKAGKNSSNKKKFNAKITLKK